MMILESLNFGSNKLKEVADLRQLPTLLSSAANRFGEQYYTHSVPALPPFLYRNKRVYSYVVNPFHLTCTCDDFKEREKIYQGRDIHKVCIHLYWKLTSGHTERFVDQLTKILIESALFHGETVLFKYQIPAEDEYIVYFGFKPGSEWCNIYCELWDKKKKLKNNYVRFGYNYDIPRWDYGTSPHKEHLIRLALDNLLKRNTAIRESCKISD